MTGDDGDILCGEWDTNGSIDAATSGEVYNIALTIKEIVRHPGYVVNPGTEQSYLQNDVAIFKVDEGPLSQEVTNSNKIYPACLPTQKRTLTEGIQSGWSKPIPEKFLKNHAATYSNENVYNNFYKQIQYRMEVFDKCEDPNNLDPFGSAVQYPTDTYYPPGSILYAESHS